MLKVFEIYWENTKLELIKQLEPLKTQSLNNFKIYLTNICKSTCEISFGNHLCTLYKLTFDLGIINDARRGT
jgi:hypothetical protein